MSRAVLIFVLSLMAASVIDGGLVLKKRSLWSKAKNLVKQASHNIGHAVSETAHDVAGVTEDVAHDVADFTEDTVHDIAHVTKDLAHDVADFTEDTVHDIAHVTKGVAHDVADFTEDAVHDIAHVVKDVAHDVDDIVTDAAHDIADVASDVADDISDLVVDSIDDIKDLSHATHDEIVKVRTWLVKEYFQAKELFEEVVDSQEFHRVVQALIPLIDSDVTVGTCTQICEAGAEFILGDVVISHTVCPFVCRGALSKLKNLMLKEV